MFRSASSKKTFNTHAKSDGCSRTSKLKPGEARDLRHEPEIIDKIEFYDRHTRCSEKDEAYGNTLEGMIHVYDQGNTKYAVAPMPQTQEAYSDKG